MNRASAPHINRIDEAPNASCFQIGLAARDVVSDGFSGSVLATGNNFVYLRSDLGEIVGLVSHQQPIHTRFLKCSAIPSGFSPGNRVTLSGNLLQVDGRSCLDIWPATVWKGTTWSDFSVNSAIQLGRECETAVATALSMLSGNNLGRVLKDILDHRQTNEGNLSRETYDSLVLQMANGIIMRYFHAPCGISGFDPQALGGLIGLGPGLTPSGDDFIGGFLFAGYHLDQVYPDLGRFDPASARRLIESASTKTNQISHALLGDWALGQGPAPLHCLLEALFTGQEHPGLEQHIARVVDIGHSSGWDMLAGFLFSIMLSLDLFDGRVEK